MGTPASVPRLDIMDVAAISVPSFDMGYIFRICRDEVHQAAVDRVIRNGGSWDEAIVVVSKEEDLLR